MKKLIFKNIFILFIITSFKLFSTTQGPDKLIYNGDTLYTYTNPLKLKLNIDPYNTKLFGNYDAGWLSSCVKGYIAEYAILENQLYLTGIFSCMYIEDSIKADLKKLFPKKYKDGKVKVDWFSSKMIAGKDLLFYENYTIYYKTEYEFLFLNGNLYHTRTFDNSKTKKSEYSLNINKFKEFIYKNINWNLLPNIDKTITMVFSFSANGNGKIDKVEITEGLNKIFDQELIKVIKQIPSWDVFYYLGNHQRVPVGLGVTFSNEIRKKYFKSKNKK